MVRIPVTLEQEVIDAILRSVSYSSNNANRFSILNKPSSVEGITTTSAIVSNQEV
jgi:hypothetical protein